MNNNEQISMLQQRVRELEAQIEKLNARANRIVKLGMDFDQLNSRHCKILDREVREAFDRIKHLELTLFPNLGHDIRAVHDIIGEGEDRADNPLDHRDQ